MKFNKDKLKADLLLNHISMKEFAKLLNSSEATVSKKMNGTVKWKYDDVLIISSIIGKEEAMSIFFEQ